MRSRGILATLIFGAAAGAGWPAFVLLAGPALGAATALHLYLLGLAVAYVAVLTPPGGRRAQGLLAALALAAAVAVLAPGIASVAAGAALVIAVGRSVIAGPGPGLRSFTLEALLAALGLLLARWLAGPDPVSVGLAIWSYFLVQSVFFCVRPARTHGDAEIDPFDRAARRAEELLADEP